MTKSGIETYREKALEMINNKGCRYLGEIEYNNEEYDRICRYALQVIRYTSDLTQPKIDLLLSIAIIQVAKRNPDSENFWDIFFTEIDEDRTEERVKFAGEVFLRTIMYYKLKVIHVATGMNDWAVQNIMWHAYGCNLTRQKNEKPVFEPELSSVADLTKRAFRFVPLETFFHHLNHLYEKDLREFPIEDIDQFKQSLEKLNKRVTRELKKKKYVGDIRINESEYEFLKMYMHYSTNQMLQHMVIPGENLFAVAAVQIAIKSYKSGNFWGNFFHEIKTKNNITLQSAIGHAFYDFLVKAGKEHVESNKFVQNILLHCFVSDYYAPAYFEFLYKFYCIDLDRDITRLDREMLNELMKSICSDERNGRSYMLVQHISQAMKVNQRGAKIRIRNHLKLLDRFFWDDEFSITSDHRLNNQMQTWARLSGELKADIEKFTYGRKKGSKRFSSPHFYFDELQDSVQIVIPVQIIKRYDNTDISWLIHGPSEYVFKADLIESVIGYKVQEISFIIPWEEIFSDYSFELVTGDGEIIKTFSIKKTEVWFFDEEGYPIRSNAIKIGDVVSISPMDTVITSSALYDKRRKGDTLLSYYQFNYGDILRLPDGHAVIVGKQEVTNGIIEKGIIERAVCCVKGQQYRLYHEFPYLVLRMKEEKFAGTSITINGKRHKLVEVHHIPFDIEDRTNDKGCYVQLAELLPHRNGAYKITVDIPGSFKNEWNFVYMKDFFVQFDGAPYVFEPRGTVTFPENTYIKSIHPACENEHGTNSYKFVIQEVGRYLNFTIGLDEIEVDVEIQIPALFIKIGETWTSEIQAPIWHSDLPDELILSAPYHKVTLYVEDSFSDYVDEANDEQEVRAYEYRKNSGDDYIRCDIRRFKSYLFGDENSKSLYIKFGEIDTELFKIMLHGILVSAQLMESFKEKCITIQATVIGKAEYYVDLLKDGKIIAEKLPMKDGRALLSGEIEAGKYQFEIFEAEDDESGFEDQIYYSLGRFQQEIINPYDMNGKSLKVLQIEKRNDPGVTWRLGYKYYIEDLEMQDAISVYRGMMVVEKASGNAVAAFPVEVEFMDIDNPAFAWISFVDEYDECMDFLYDTRRKGILQEENPCLPKLECYRRYSMLDYEEQIFHLEFCTREKSNYFSLPEVLEFPEMAQQIVFKQAKHQMQHEKYIFDENWSKDCLACLNVLGCSTFRELSEFSSDKIMRQTDASEDTVAKIEKKMNFYGYFLSK